jgi:hypothetical protein
MFIGRARQVCCALPWIFGKECGFAVNHFFHFPVFGMELAYRYAYQALIEVTQ